MSRITPGLSSLIGVICVLLVVSVCSIWVFAVLTYQATNILQQPAFDKSDPEAMEIDGEPKPEPGDPIQAGEPRRSGTAEGPAEP